MVGPIRTGTLFTKDSDASFTSRDNLQSSDQYFKTTVSSLDEFFLESLTIIKFCTDFHSGLSHAASRDSVEKDKVNSA